MTLNMCKRDHEERLKDRVERLEEEVSNTQDRVEGSNEQLRRALLTKKLTQSEVNALRQSLDENEINLIEYHEELVSCREEQSLLSGPRKRKKIERTSTTRSSRR
jgi:chromosome segregation ATPase